MCTPINIEFERAIKQLTKKEISSNKPLNEVIEQIREGINDFLIIPKLKVWFHEFCHKISIDEIMTNRPLIANIERLDRMFRVVEA